MMVSGPLSLFQPTFSFRFSLPALLMGKGSQSRAGWGHLAKVKMFPPHCNQTRGKCWCLPHCPHCHQPCSHQATCLRMPTTTTQTPPALSHTALLFRAEDLTGTSLTQRICKLLYSKNATPGLNPALQKAQPQGALGKSWE